MDANYVLRAQDGREYAIPAVARIGRDADCAIALNDTAVSRHHASVWVERGRLFITDEKSANGVYVNRAALERPAARRE